MSEAPPPHRPAEIRVVTMNLALVIAPEAAVRPSHNDVAVIRKATRAAMVAVADVLKAEGPNRAVLEVGLILPVDDEPGVFGIDDLDAAGWFDGALSSSVRRTA